MNEEYLPLYIKKIRSYKPKYIHGFPSAITLLARYVLDKGIKDFPKIKAILAVSENIYPGQRELIEKAFNSRLFSFYGMSERVIMAHECEFDNRYHAFPEYGIIEIVGRDNLPVDVGERGELVGTGFLNRCMPFIRYRTGDLGSIEEQECKCGRSHIILKNIQGRILEMIVDKNNNLIPPYFHLNEFKNIYKYQYYQKKEGELIIKIIPNEEFNKQDEKRIRDNIYQRVGNNLDILIKYVGSIPLTSSGKFKLIIQDLDIEKYY
jgi:phenylacetate-CoA ligase